jgi:3-phenylpropionate/cinnamic acid dioxygenase small subunit
MSDQATSELLERLARLEDQAAICRTLYEYGSALDYGDRDQFLGCFTRDAEYVVTMRTSGEEAMHFRGHGQLADYFDGHTHAPAAWHKHITTNPDVAVDGDGASATSYFIRVDSGADAGPATVLASGRYRDELVRDGTRWRISSRRCEVENL